MSFTAIKLQASSNTNRSGTLEDLRMSQLAKVREKRERPVEGQTNGPSSEQDILSYDLLTNCVVCILNFSFF